MCMVLLQLVHDLYWYQSVRKHQEEAIQCNHYSFWFGGCVASNSTNQGCVERVQTVSWFMVSSPVWKWCSNLWSIATGTCVQGSGRSLHLISFLENFSLSLLQSRSWIRAVHSLVYLFWGNHNVTTTKHWQADTHEWHSCVLLILWPPVWPWILMVLRPSSVTPCVCVRLWYSEVLQYL